ncbi:hypothetical protein AVEN_47289-1, partial [Araneus ventricosus]
EEHLQYQEMFVFCLGFGTDAVSQSHYDFIFGNELIGFSSKYPIDRFTSLS